MPTSAQVRAAEGLPAFRPHGEGHAAPFASPRSELSSAVGRRARAGPAREAVLSSCRVAGVSLHL